jgi:hypothetical protein
MRGTVRDEAGAGTRRSNTDPRARSRNRSEKASSARSSLALAPPLVLGLVLRNDACTSSAESTMNGKVARSAEVVVLGTGKGTGSEDDASVAHEPRGAARVRTSATELHAACVRSGTMDG